MFRTIAMLMIFCTAATAHAEIVAPYGQGNAPGVKKEKGAVPAADTGKIIGDVKADFQEAVKNLSEQDAGAATRRKQQSILDGLDKLLNQEDKAPNDVANPSGPQSPSKQPKPPERGKEHPVESAKEARKTDIAAPAQSGDHPAQSIADMKWESKKSGRWGDLPPRHRQEIDAFARDRFVRNYEELLRAYYRNIAESGQKDRD